MARKKNSKLAGIVVGPALVIGGLMALWENEGRFDYFAAARDAQVVSSPFQVPDEAIAFTATLNTGIPIAGQYVSEFTGFHTVRRTAEIYSWEEDTDSDGNTTWDLDWYSSIDSNSRNGGLQQRLSSSSLYPQRYELGSLEVAPQRIHFADQYVSIAPGSVPLSSQGSSTGLRAGGDYFYLDKGRSDKLGDERISYRGIPNAATVSYFGVVSSDRAIGKQYEVNDGIISAIIGNDGILHHLVNGDRAEALDKIKADIARKTWMVRIFGTLAVCMGFGIFFGVFMGLLYRIPLIGGIVQFGVLVVSLALGLVLSLGVILSSLVIHNPLTVALPLLIVLGGIVWLSLQSRNASTNARKVMEDKLSLELSTPEQAMDTSPVSSLHSPQPEASATPALSKAELIERSFVNLALVAMSGGKLHRKEHRFLASWGKSNGISPTRMKELFDRAKDDPPQDHRATRTDLELMACMAMADGVLSNGEWRFLLRIARRLGLESKELRKLLVDIGKGAELDTATA